MRLARWVPARPFVIGAAGVAWFVFVRQHRHNRRTLAQRWWPDSWPPRQLATMVPHPAAVFAVRALGGMAACVVCLAGLEVGSGLLLSVLTARACPLPCMLHRAPV